MTIKDVAAYSGVSVSTVSRVLNDHPDVSDGVRERVWAAVHALHYVPNNAARDLVRPTSDSIGLVVRGAENPFFTPIIRAIDETAKAAGYTVVLHQIRAGEDELAAAAELARSKRLLGLILLGGSTDYTAERTARLGVPFVCCSFTNSFGTLSAADYSSVSIDDERAAAQAVTLLYERGHRDIGILLSAPDDRSISELRCRGYRRALRENGLASDDALVLACGSYDMSDAYRCVRAAIDGGLRFTALFCISDAMAMAAIKALSDAGVRVPEDCSVIAIDGIESTLYTIPTLTTLVQPKEAMGRRAVELLDALLHGGGCRCELLDTSLREGGSVCSRRT